MSGEVLFDGWCGEPIAWARVGEPVIGHEWTEHGQVAVTERLTPAEAVRRYGPIAEVVLGRNGGFESVTYDAKKFVSRFVDPRGTGLYDDSVVVVHDPAKENYECPVCGAAPGEQCLNKKQQPCATHNKREQGRSRWEIEQAEAAARKAHEEAEAAEQWQRDMATPPATGAVLEIERWKLAQTAALDPWVPDVPGRVTVEHSYANRTVRATAENGEQVFLARNEYTGDWHVICGQPTSMRLPCRGGVGMQCRTQHKAGLHLREDKPWS
jgi:hypothetical protein